MRPPRPHWRRRLIPDRSVNPADQPNVWRLAGAPRAANQYVKRGRKEKGSVPGLQQLLNQRLRLVFRNAELPVSKRAAAVVQDWFPVVVKEPGSTEWFCVYRLEDSRFAPRGPLKFRVVPIGRRQRSIAD